MTDAFNDIPAFVAAVEANGFAAAARRLNLSRSAVGKAIARLEARLGVRLFHRTTRSQALTEDGAAFYEHCLRAMDELSTGKARLEVGRQAVSGRLRVSMPVLFGRLCIAPVLTRLASRHPDLELELQFSDRLVDLLEEGVDLSVRMGELGHGAGLMTRGIARERMAVCGAPSMLDANALPRTLDDLSAYPAIVYARNGRSQNWLFRREQAPIVHYAPRSRLKFDDLEAMADAAAAGYGLAWLPLWLVRNRVRGGELVCVLDEDPAPGFDIHALWPQMPYMPPRVRVALDALVAEVPAFVSA
ncbi:LysR substrate-binding domain-containing protein [Burkholderia sp. Cy-637]|uniref:LysR substrate-binding domain-containing protein n=1 Tax=Burkholderia sp. Cy-637 TaxID=2608327 RepID=UPI001420B50B|nr:LysR substrate-binding domain-containing protein [Burkholderia sp. Cy-637]NIF90353.1 LysR family transcriptional regulator [Burkholderia sp. Cy-637]